MHLDGSADYLTAPYTTFDDSGNFAFTTWVRFDSHSATNIIFDTRDDANDGLFQSWYTDPSLRFGYNTEKFTTGSVLNDNQWYFLALVCNKTDNWLKLYVDCEFYGSLDITGVSISTSTAYTWGRRSFGTTEYLDGYLDDIRFYEAVLPNETIQNIMSLKAIRLEWFNYSTNSYQELFSFNTLESDYWQSSLNYFESNKSRIVVGGGGSAFFDEITFYQANSLISTVAWNYIEVSGQ
ncbi:MAG: LamG domain-containing protein [Candidatus Hodarchaeota archaeon]